MYSYIKHAQVIHSVNLFVTETQTLQKPNSGKAALRNRVFYLYESTKAYL